MKTFKKCSILMLIFIFLFSINIKANTSATEINFFDKAYQNTGSYLKNTVISPTVGSIGGEWAIIGLARSDIEVSEKYFQSYLENLEKYLKEHNGILHEKKYTEYSRVILALSSIGISPENFCGYNLLLPLGDYKKTISQGINGPIWALIALDSNSYELPVNPEAEIQSSREMYVDYILKSQNPDGGWALSGNSSNTDITAMALQSLSKYQEDERVKSATEKALNFLSEVQKKNEGFSFGNAETSESSVQVLLALCELNIPLNDKRFVKDEISVLDNILGFYVEDKGFKHIKNETETNLMATEQCFYGLVAAKRFKEGKNSLYSMSDSRKIAINENVSDNIADTTKTIPFFNDIINHKNKAAIEALTAAEILNGKTADIFAPDDLITRAEFAKVLVLALKLTSDFHTKRFNDVNESDWFYSYVSIAAENSIINGISDDKFNPDGNLTREEAAAMLERAVSLYKPTEADTSEIRNILAGFVDYISVSDWALKSTAICYKYNIFDDSELEIKPQAPVLRCEIAQCVYNLLKEVNLL